MTIFSGAASARVAIVEATKTDMHISAYKNRLEAVLSMIDNGAFGGGVGYGCDEHKAALDRVEAQIKETRVKIVVQNSED